MQYYYAVSNNRLGPVEESELAELLRSGTIHPSTLVWCAGMPQWAPLSAACPNLVPDAPTYDSVQAPVFDYVGFWPRVGAYLIDNIIVSIAAQIIGGAIGLGLGGIRPMEADDPKSIAMVFAIAGAGAGAGILVKWLYYAFMESSSCQGTLGKMAIGAKVVDSQGNRITFGRATGRFLAKGLSALILNFGFFMIGWDDLKQGLHDKIAGTYVVKNR